MPSFSDWRRRRWLSHSGFSPRRQTSTTQYRTVGSMIWKMSQFLRWMCWKIPQHLLICGIESFIILCFVSVNSPRETYHGSRLGCETNGLSRSTLQRALLVVILLTSMRSIKNFTKRNALSGINCNYLHEWIFGLPLNPKQFWINLIFIPPIFDCKPINWYQYENYKTYRPTPYR